MKESAKQRPRGTIFPVQRAVRVKSDSLGKLVYWEDAGTGGEGRPVWLEEARKGEAVCRNLEKPIGESILQKLSLLLDKPTHHQHLDYRRREQLFLL